MCILAEHERNVIRERTKAGLTAARVRGRKGGRPFGLSERYQLIAPEVKKAHWSHQIIFVHLFVHPHFLVIAERSLNLRNHFLLNPQNDDLLF